MPQIVSTRKIPKTMLEWDVTIFHDGHDDVRNRETERLLELNKQCRERFFCG